MHIKEAIISWVLKIFNKLHLTQPYIFLIEIKMVIIWEINILMVMLLINLITFSKKIN